MRFLDAGALNLQFGRVCRLNFFQNLIAVGLKITFWPLGRVLLH